jgi:hypothetical protein
MDPGRLRLRLKPDESEGSCYGLQEISRQVCGKKFGENPSGLHKRSGVPHGRKFNLKVCFGWFCGSF